MSETDVHRIPWRVQGAVCAAGVFSNSSFHRRSSSPVIMGGVIEFVGLERGFFIMGAGILLALFAGGLAMQRRKGS